MHSTEANLRDAIFEYIEKHETDARLAESPGPEGLEALVDVTVGYVKRLVVDWNRGAVGRSSGWLGQ